MKTIIKILLKYSLLFTYGGFIYMTIEMLYRGFTNYYMGICGGLSFVFIGCINNFISWNLSILLQSFIGGFLIITPLEYLFGIAINKDYSVWSYKDMPFNYNGQICLTFTLLWCLLSVVAIIIDDYLRYYIFDEEKPKYKIL